MYASHIFLQCIIVTSCIAEAVRQPHVALKTSSRYWSCAVVQPQAEDATASCLGADGQAAVSALLDVDAL
jgi:hypothetical protein